MNITEVKTDSQWKVIKKKTNSGIVKYSLTNGEKFLEVDGATKFVNVSPIINGVGAVAVEKHDHKTVKVEWFIVNEEGVIVYRIHGLSPKRIDDVNQNTFLIPARNGSKFLIVGKTGIIETFTLPSQLGKYLKNLTFPEETSPEI